MTPEQIPDEVVELIRFKLVFSEMNSHNIRTALAAGLAAWDGARQAKSVHPAYDPKATVLILPLKETGE